MDSTWKWLTSKAGQKATQDSKDKAWAEFKRRYPRVTKNLRNVHGVFHNKFQKHFQGHKDHTRNRKGGKKMVGRPKCELLATAAELCRVVCNDWLQNIT